MRIYVDTETSGLKSPDSCILEIAAVLLDNEGGEIDVFASLVNPGEEALALASPEALSVNGLTLDDLRKAPPQTMVAEQFKTFVGRYPEARIHAFNNGFDAWFLARFPWSVQSTRWGECVMLASMASMEKSGALDRFQDGNVRWPRLEAAAKFFGVPYARGHRALEDARAAARVHTEILKDRIAALDEACSFFDDVSS